MFKKKCKQIAVKSKQTTYLWLAQTISVSQLTNTHKSDTAGWTCCQGIRLIERILNTETRSYRASGLSSIRLISYRVSLCTSQAHGQGYKHFAENCVRFRCRTIMTDQNMNE